MRRALAPLVRPVVVARFLAAVAAALFLVDSLDHAYRADADPWLWLGLDLAVIVSLGRRRLRLAGLTWLLATGLMRWSSFSELTALGCLASLGAALVLFWPRWRARSETDPLPQLDLVWVLLAGATLAAVDLSIDFASVRGVEEAVLRTIVASMLVVGVCGLAPVWRWSFLLRGSGAAASVLLVMPSAARERDDLLLMTAGSVAFALAFDWLRSPATAGGRWWRGTGFVLGVSLLPVLIVAPHQVLTFGGIAYALLRAAAHGTAVALATRAAASSAVRRRRPPLYRAQPGARLGVLSVAAVGSLLFAAVVFGDDFLAFGLTLVAVVIAFVWPLRVRAIGTLLTIAAGGVLAALLGVGGWPMVSFGFAFWTVACVASSPRVRAHFVRRRRPVALPSVVPRGAALVGAGGFAIAAFVLGLVPSAHTHALDALVGAAPLESSAFAPRGLGRDADASVPGRGATVVLDPLGRGTWVVDEERDSVTLIGAAGELRRIAVGAWPEQLVVDDDGRVYVSCRQAGEIAVIDRAFAVTRIAVGVEPRALALDAASSRLYVGLVTQRAVVALDTERLTAIGSVALGFEPREMTPSPHGIAVLPGRGDAVEIVERDLAGVRRVPLYASGRRVWHGQAILASGRDLVVVHAAVDTGLDSPVAHGGYGGTVREPVEMLVAVLRDGRPAVYPRLADARRRLPIRDATGIELRDGRLVVASRASQQLLSCTIDGVGRRHGCRTLAIGDGLAGIAVRDDGGLLTLAAFDRELIALDAERRESRRSIGDGLLDEQLALGRSLFHRADHRISTAGFACVTCHPDGREDGLVWRLGGARRQTPMLVGRLADTMPYDWHGGSATLTENVVQTIGRLRGAGLEAREVEALARYLVEGLREPVVPRPADAILVARGRELFRSDDVGCVACHLPDFSFAGVGPQDVGSVSERERREAIEATRTAPQATFDTPSLRFVSLSAPYFHDGSVATLEELIDGNRDRMGQTEHLSPEDRKALIAYLSTL